jgi:mono/diheme cytochrome c family protein
VLYLYVMNGNANYIIHASLLLAVAASSFLFLRNIPSPLIESQQQFECGTEDLPKKNLTSQKAQQGKALFMSKCASCHVLNKNLTGPGLAGFTERDPWTIKQNVYDWIRNPSAFMEKDRYTRELKKQYGTMMQAFPNLTDKEIDAIVEYIEQ